MSIFGTARPDDGDSDPADRFTDGFAGGRRGDTAWDESSSEASVVLVTNVGQGFGRAIALGYGQTGFHVVCADKDVDLASKTAAEIEELGGQAIPIQADMTTQMDVKNAFNKVFEIFGDLTGVVHVASSESQTRFRDLSEGEFTELFVEDVRSTFLTLKMAERLLGRAWLVLISPPKSATEPHMLSIRGAITRMAAAFEARNDRLQVNVVVPSRAASDPKHDAPLVQAVRFLGSSTQHGISGHRLYVELPPPPRLLEAMLPEVRAALDSSVRQDDLEASLYQDDLDDLGDDLGEDADDILDENAMDFESADDEGAQGDPSTVLNYRREREADEDVMDEELDRERHYLGEPF